MGFILYFYFTVHQHIRTVKDLNYRKIARILNFVSPVCKKETGSLERQIQETLKMKRILNRELSVQKNSNIFFKCHHLRSTRTVY